MTNIFFLLLFALFLNTAVSTANSADQSAVSAMNTALSGKPMIERSQVVNIKRERCRSRGRPAGDSGAFGQDCETYYDQQVQSVQDYARVQSSEVVEVRDFNLDIGKMTKLPETAFFAGQSIDNCAEVSLTTTVSLSVSVTRGYSVTKTQGINTTKSSSYSVARTFQVAAGGIGASDSVSMQFGFSKDISLSSSVTDSSSESISRSQSATVSADPGKSARFEVLVYQLTVEIPFNATVIVDGELEANHSGVTRAKQLLSEKERTLPFSGILRITDASEANISTTSLPGKISCAGARKGVVLKDNYEKTVPAKGLPADIKKRFAPAQKPAAKMSGLSLTNESDPKWNYVSGTLAGDTIGPADGVFFTVEFTTEVIKPNPVCGFNDIGAMNPGIYIVEHRHYRQYQKGIKIAEWRTQPERFGRCAPVP